MSSMHLLLLGVCISLLTACATTGSNTTVEGAVNPGSRSMDLYREGMEAYSEGEFAVAESKLSELLEKIPEDAQVRFRLGNIYARTNRPRQAVKAYQEALIRDPELAKAWHNMGIVHLRQAANDFVSLARSVPTQDPLYERGMKISNAILALLNELPGNSNVEVDIDLNQPVEAGEAVPRPEEEQNNGPGQAR